MAEQGTASAGTTGSDQTERVARGFIEALRRLEEGDDLEPIVGTYAEGAEIGNVASPKTFRGAEGAREFWRVYKGTLGEIRSEFRNVFAAEGRAALEWTTTGASPEGHRIEYDGVSILEVEGDKITRFHAYFDPSRLGRQVQDGD